MFICFHTILLVKALGHFIAMNASLLLLKMFTLDFERIKIQHEN